jgi:hypothetical protein
MQRSWTDDDQAHHAIATVAAQVLYGGFVKLAMDARENDREQEA